MDDDTRRAFEDLKERLKRIERSVEKTRRYLLWTFILTIVVFVLPLLALLFILPQFVRTIGSAYGF